MVEPVPLIRKRTVLEGNRGGFGIAFRLAERVALGDVNAIPRVGDLVIELSVGLQLVGLEVLGQGFGRLAAAQRHVAGFHQRPSLNELIDLG